jgi:hypothetical protein
MVSLALFLAAFGPSSTRYGFPSGNSSAAPIDAFATVTPVSCEDVVSPPPHRADLWNLSTPNAEETQSPFSLGFVDPQCGMFATPGFPPHHAMSDCRCRLAGVSCWSPRQHHFTAGPQSPAEAAVVLTASSCGHDLAAALHWFEHVGQPTSDPHLAACRRLLLEITVYLAMHPHRVYDVGVMFILLAWFITRPRAWAQLLLSTWLGSLSAATYFFHLALQFCLYDGHERTLIAPPIAPTAPAVPWQQPTSTAHAAAAQAAAADAFRAACAGRPAARLAERSAGTSQLSYISASASHTTSSGSACPLPPPTMACLPTLRPRLICPRAMLSCEVVHAPYHSYASHWKTCGSLRPRR